MRSQRLRLLLLAHANRTAGGRSVGQGFLQALVRRNELLEVIPVLPVGCGYEDIVSANALPTIWFEQKRSHIRRFLFDVALLPREARSSDPHAILALGNIGIRNPSVPQVILIHDPHFVYPPVHHGCMPTVERIRYVVQRRQLAHCIAEAALVYCQTRTMLQRVHQIYKRDSAIKLLPNSLPLASSMADASKSVPKQLTPYIDRFRLICLTRYYSHKNLEMIVETFRRHRDDLKDVVVFLTIPPDQSREADRLLTTAHRFRLEDQIINLGYIEQSEIPAYFGNCHALLFPTLLESFSTTYLEAMHCGLPILTSDLDFAHEVCGPAALYFDPWSPDSVAEAIIRLRSDEQLRRRLAEAGHQQLARAHNHSWDDMADTIVSDLRDIVGRAG